jgi:hypothetical protein
MNPSRVHSRVVMVFMALSGHDAFTGRERYIHASANVALPKFVHLLYAYI